MGTSNWQNISYCCELIYRLQPQRILDIGVGSLGRWATLAREFSDVWGGRVLQNQWMCTVDGVEAFADQIGPLHRALYDHVFVGDAFDVIDRLDHYDLVIMGDVLEHFEPERAVDMLKKCLTRSAHTLIVTPLGEGEEWQQDEMYGNPWEEHRSLFSVSDFLHDDRWFVVKSKVFRDYIERPFGVFLLRAKNLGRTRYRRGFRVWKG